MKLTKIYQLSGMSLLAVSLAVVPFTKSSQAQAQTGTEPQVSVVKTEDDGFDWGWLGLLGLLGLAGLAGKNKSQEHHEVRGTEPFPESPVDRSDTQYR